MEKIVLSNKDKTSIKKISFVDMKRQYFLLKNEILSTVDEVFSSGSYILGEAVQELEEKVAEYLGCRYVLGVANGTDALILALKALKISYGDEVILPVNSFIATAGAVHAVGAVPVLCDVSENLNIDTAKIETLITGRTKAIIPVHLTGRPAEMDKITEIAKQYSLAVVEDAAQSIRASYKNKITGFFC